MNDAKALCCYLIDRLGLATPDLNSDHLYVVYCRLFTVFTVVYACGRGFIVKPCAAGCK